MEQPRRERAGHGQHDAAVQQLVLCQHGGRLRPHRAPGRPSAAPCDIPGAKESAGEARIGAQSHGTGTAAGREEQGFVGIRTDAVFVAWQADDEVIARIFPDICPRELRIAEVKSWECPWMDMEFPVSPESETAATLSKQPLQGGLLSQATKTGKSSTPVTSPSARARVDAQAPAPTAANGNRVHRAVENVDSTAKELDNEINSLTNQLSLEEKQPWPLSPPKTTEWSGSAGTPPPVSTPRSGAPLWKAVESAKRTPGSRSGKRPQLRLKLEDMPTPQQAEERAQRAATRLIAKRDAMEAAAIAAAAASGSNTPANGPSAAQQAMMKLNFSSGSDSDLQSPNGAVYRHFYGFQIEDANFLYGVVMISVLNCVDGERHSAGSAYSPNHGMFTTRNVAVSEAGISSPDAACLHLQENLERVKEVGRGASGVVYKAIHIPTLKVVAVKVSVLGSRLSVFPCSLWVLSLYVMKDVPVYGRGQRRQMVRELHALYSNLVPMADNDNPMPQHPSTGKSGSKPKAKYAMIQQLCYLLWRGTII